MKFKVILKLTSLLFVFAVLLTGAIACEDEGNALRGPLVSEIAYQFVGHLEEIDDQGRLFVWEASIKGDVTGDLKWWFVQPAPVSSTPYAGGRVDYYAAILKSLFPEIFCYENKRKRSAFDAKQASVIRPDLHCWRFSHPAMVRTQLRRPR